MLSTRPRAALVVSLFLSYQLVLLLCTPCSMSGASLIRGKVAGSVQQTVSVRYREGEIPIRFREGVSEKDKETIIATQGGRKKKELKGDSGFEKLELAAGRDTKTAVLQLLLNPQVEFAEPNFLIAKEDVNPNDPQFQEQWALQNSGQGGGQFDSDIRARSAWDKTRGAASTIIAVIDSGIDFTHPDLANNQWTNPQPNSAGDLHGWDFVADNGEIKDEQGHGTAVAGIIAAEGNNALGITGVMWGAGLMSLRVLDNTGTGDIGNAVEAIDYAVAHGAHVINLSWGTTGESIVLKEAIERAIKRDVIVVCSAGNNGQDLDTTPYYPASFGLKDLIAVSATDNRDQLASWSNWGVRKVTIAAPGTNILTTQRGGGYWSVTGTSAAAPIVSGIAGLLKTLSPAGSLLAVAELLETRLVRDSTGRSIVDIYSLVEQIVREELPHDINYHWPALWKGDLLNSTDSLDDVEIVLRMEESFGFSIPDRDAQEMHTVGQTIRYLWKRIFEQSFTLRPSPPDVCPGTFVFHELRRLLIIRGGVPRGSVRLDSRLGDLLPSWHSHFWKQIQNVFGVHISYGNLLTRSLGLEKRITIKELVALITSSRN
jgi:acyl carrier protein